ncbi:NAD(+) diphosphatase [Yoonia sp. SS1-5]|uniref:NAD(+) diphosphatase n=1 Tax=Yoonia rhodophyticola TaxID=3137370 RepID=A0ABZ3JC25_9RHOB
MKNAELVTFGNGGLDRAAEWRADSVNLRNRPDAKAVVLWRGKPLVQADALVKIPLDHPLLADAADEMILLGRSEGAPLFAADISGWVPQDLDLTTLDTFLDPTEQVHPALPDAAFRELRGIMTGLDRHDAEVAATAKAIMGWHRSHRFCARCGQESTMAMAGWQRDCAACGGHHFPRTDPVVIMLITHGNDVLLGRSPGWPEGMYSCLAGFVEPGETIEAAVRRETFEEAGVAVGRVSYLSSQPWPFPASLMFGCLGEALSTDLHIDPAEIEDARWVSREELAKAVTGQHPDILPARKGAIAHFLLENWLADRLE